MKKINCLMAIVLILFIAASCSKESADDSNLILKNATGNVASLPVSSEGIEPLIIPGINKGGNRTCAEVGSAFMNNPQYFDYCGTKIDFVDGEFIGEFPFGLNVIVTYGRFVSFESSNCLKIGGSYHKIGAVIVKGGDNANVYLYPDGSYGDRGLTAPVNHSDMPASEVVFDLPFYYTVFFHT